MARIRVVLIDVVWCVHGVVAPDPCAMEAVTRLREMDLAVAVGGLQVVSTSPPLIDEASQCNLTFNGHIIETGTTSYRLTHTRTHQTPGWGQIRPSRWGQLGLTNS